MAYTKTYETFYWQNQTINEKLVNSVRVRIFKPHEVVAVDRDMQLVSTDGERFHTGPKSTKTSVHNYSHILLSTGIREKFHPYSSTYILSIKLFITERFDISTLADKEFMEKPYVLEALRNFKGFQTGNQFSFSDCLAEKIEPSRIALMHDLFTFHAQSCDFDKVEQLFKDYKITVRAQAIFWKEMYQMTAKKQK